MWRGPENPFKELEMFLDKKKKDITGVGQVRELEEPVEIYLKDLPLLTSSARATYNSWTYVVRRRVALECLNMVAVSFWDGSYKKTAVHEDHGYYVYYLVQCTCCGKVFTLYEGLGTREDATPC